MQKYVVFFTKNQNWCIYALELNEVLSGAAGNPDRHYEIDKTAYSTDWRSSVKVTGKHSIYAMPVALRRSANAYGARVQKIDPKFVFDSREAAQKAVDLLVKDNIMNEISSKEKQIESIQNEIERLKVSSPKGKFRNLLKKDPVLP